LGFFYRPPAFRWTFDIISPWEYIYRTNYTYTSLLALLCGYFFIKIHSVKRRFIANSLTIHKNMTVYNLKTNPDLQIRLWITKQPLV